MVHAKKDIEMKTTTSNKTETYWLDNTASIHREDYPTYYQYRKAIAEAKRHFQFWEVVTGGMRFWMYSN